MEFTPFTDEEWNDTESKKVLLPIECNFNVILAEENVSNAGNEQFKVELLFTQSGITGKVFDWIGKADNMRWKLKQFARSIADDKIVQLMKEGRLSASDFIGKTGKAKLRKKQDSNFMEIHFYIDKDPSVVKVDTAPPKVEAFNDDIPF